MQEDRISVPVEKQLLLPQWRCSPGGILTQESSKNISQRSAAGTSLASTESTRIKFGPAKFCRNSPTGTAIDSSGYCDLGSSDFLKNDVADFSAPCKLFSFCRAQFPKLSKRQLHSCFVRSEVVLNGSRLGRGSETKLLCDGDVVSIESATDGPETSDRLVRAGVAIMHHSAELCVIYKPPGIGCADGSDLDFAIKNCVWPRTTPSDPERLLHEGRLLYAIGKNQGGILIAVSSPHVLEVACNAVMTGRLILRARCVVCGKIIDNAKSVVSVGVTEIGQLPQFCIFVDELPEVELVVTLVEVSPCRAVGELSVIDIVPRFRTTTAPDSRSGGSSFRPPGSIRSVMKHIKFIMSQAGHTIVGDFDMVKKDKGVYLSLYSLKNSDPSLSGFSEVLCAIPDKFAKLLEREKAFHSKAIAKGIKILQDGNACDPEVIRSLEAGYPPEYVAGCAEFLGRSFIVNDSVMIPRKSSAVLVEAAIRWASHSMDSLCRKITILDIGTGSGCLLLSCIAELQRLYPDVSVFGVGIDICPKALAVARENCQRMNLTKSVKFIEQNFDNLDSLAQSLNAGLDLPYSFDAGIFNIILCNPPYSVPYRDSRISRSRIMYEPGVALFGISSNMTGIEFSAEENGKKRKSECRDEFTSYRIISDSLRRCFERDSCHTGDCAPLFQESAAFFFEVGNGQSDRAAAILKTGSTGLTLRCLHSDFKGLPRCIELGYHRISRLDSEIVSATSSSSVVTPVVVDKKAALAIMAPKSHGTCPYPVQERLRWGCDHHLADQVTCFNRRYAENSGYWEQRREFTAFVSSQQNVPNHEITFYDSVTGEALFVAPRGRSMEAFLAESRAHGWPSFRDEEVVWSNVRILPDGEAVSASGSHLGHNIPDRSGNRYCINLVSISGSPAQA